VIMLSAAAEVSAGPAAVDPGPSTPVVREFGDCERGIRRSALDGSDKGKNVAQVGSVSSLRRAPQLALPFCLCTPSAWGLLLRLLALLTSALFVGRGGSRQLRLAQ
jgi:hypothetical protein